MIEIPEASVISQERANELIASAKQHVQIVCEGHGIHAVMQDGIVYVVKEMTLAEARKCKPS